MRDLIVINIRRAQVMGFISSFIKGLVIGIGAIIPGVSGGALAVMLCVYDKLTYAIANIFKNFKRSLMFLFPIGLGGIIGILAFSRMMRYLLVNYDVEVRYLFIGLIMGTFPSVFKEANKKGFKKKYIASFITPLVIIILFAVFGNQGTSVISEQEPGIIQLMGYGAIIGFGTIAPGISASFILMYLGAYEIILEAISKINLMVLIPVSIGSIFSILIFANLINSLFKKAYGYTYYALLGFVMASIIPIFPGIALTFNYFICLLIAAAGFYLSLSLNRCTG